MPLFGFSDQYALFDQTPVDNQFIMDYLPDAKGDYVKVYLYGLMQCYHPQEGESPATVAHVLGMELEDVQAAFRYWERKRLVERIQDNPPVWRYVSPRERLLSKGDVTKADEAYAEFVENLQQLFGNARKLSGRESQMAYEWVEDLGLPAQIVMLMVSSLIDTRGVNFKFSAAQKVAMEMADANILHEEEAEEYLNGDKRMYSGARQVLRRLGKRRAPSDDEVRLYTAWVRELGFAHDAVEAACAETVKGEPTMGYLDGILRGMLSRTGTAARSAAEVEAIRENDSNRIKPLKALLAVMHINVTVNEQTLAAYDDMRILYPDEVILIAGRECARHKQGAGLDDVLSMLGSWKDRGLTDVAGVMEYVNAFNTRSRMVAELKEKWGQPRRITAADREMVAAWTGELAMPWETVLYCAAFAGEAQRPMAYLDKLLREYAGKGLRTIDAVCRERGSRDNAWADTARRKVKTVIEQQYEQRTCIGDVDPLDWIRLVAKEEDYAQ